MKREGLNYKLFIFLCITFFHSLSSFGYDAEVNGIYYNFSGTTATVTYPSQGTYTGSVVIPETVTYKDVTYNVKKIGYEAFAESSGLTSITIPNSVTSIEFLAFYKCSGLTSITIPNSVTNIEHEVFWLCSGLTSITIPNSVTSIKDGTFYGCSSITSFSIPNSVTSIGSQAFYYCSSLTSITIPSNVTSIGTWAFGYCSGLSDVISGIKEPFEIDGTIFKGIHSDAVLTVPNGTRDKYLAITGWTKHFKDVREQEGLASTYTLSVKATGNGSASYNGQAIKNSTTNFTINEGTSATISFSPDSGYRIKSVKVNNADVTSSVSSNSYTISSISANTTLEVEFEAIPPTTYTLSIKVIGNGSASYNGTSVRYGTTNFSVNSGSNATVKFYPDDGYRIKSVKVNNSDVTSSVSNDQYTISNISSDTTLEVEYEADTYNLSIKATGNGSVSFNGMTIKNQTYTVNVNGGSSLTISFTPDSGYRIKSVKVNDTDVTSSVSSNTYNINSISANTTLEVEFEADSQIISFEDANVKAICIANWDTNGDGELSEQEAAAVKDIGKLFSNNTTITSFKELEYFTGLISISPYAFYYCSGLTSITLPNNIISIGDWSFCGCGGLTTIAIPNNVATIGISAFSECTGLNSITIPNSVTSIGKWAFSPCSSLVSIVVESSNSVYDSRNNCNAIIHTSSNNMLVGCMNTIIPNSITSIDDWAFTDCYGLNSITIHSGVTFIGEHAFEGCSDLVSIVVESGNSVYDSRNNCNAIIHTSSNNMLVGCMNTIIPNSVTSIGTSAFYKCHGLSHITIPNSVTVIDSHAFQLCSNLVSIMIPNSVASIGNYAFNNCSNLKEVKSAIINPYKIDDGVFSGIPSEALLYVPTGTKEKYQLYTGWIENFKEMIEGTTDEYILSIKSTGNGFASYNGNTIKNQTSTFTVNGGTNVSIVFSPDNGNRLNTVKVNEQDVTSQVYMNQYSISNITADIIMEVTFVEDVSAITVDRVNYKVISQSDKTVYVTSGSYGQVLTVPASISSNGSTWTVVGIETDALSGNLELAAVIWNPEATFNATVSNPNLLLYVKAEQYAPATIQNVVVNGTASNIELKEASSGNAFYCPQAFTAQQISYTHNYQMQTGVGESRGWETIALPFDVQMITHETKGSIVPFAQWKSGDATKPFWLYELAGTGFVEASNIQAYTPYIISMPNNPQYDSEWLLNGKVTFAASGVVVGKTENLNQPTFNNRIFIPCFADKNSDTGLYALNVNNDFETNNSGVTEGSIFMWKLRSIHPFEAFMTSSSSAPQYSFGVFEGMTTGIQTMVDGRWTKKNVVYDLQGRKVESPSKKGVYIVNGKKKIIK